MPKDVVDEMSVGRDASRSGRGLAKLWEDGSLFTQELSQNQSEKQQLPTQTKSSCESDQQVVTLQEEMNVQEEATVTPAENGTSVMELESSFHSEVSEDVSPSQELQV